MKKQPFDAKKRTYLKTRKNGNSTEYLVDGSWVNISEMPLPTLLNMYEYNAYESNSSSSDDSGSCDSGCSCGGE